MTATFRPRTYTLTLIVDASASHDHVNTTVRSTPSGITCSAPPYPKTCTMTVNHGTSVRLDATGDFAGISWMGCTVATSNERRCSVVVDGNKRVDTSSFTVL